MAVIRRIAATSALPDPNDWVYIVSSAYASLPTPGNRVVPAIASNMPTITVTAGAGSGAFVTANAAHNYRLVGLNIKAAAGSLVATLVDFGTNVSSLANVPQKIVVDRCYVHPDATLGGIRGIAMNAAYGVVIDSYVDDFKADGNDSQAVWTYNSPGPLKICNNWLSASGENFMSGGAEPDITDLVPSDIEIKKNYFTKDLTWLGSAWDVKNFIEFKNAQRVIITGNVCNHNWEANQFGYGWLVTPRNENGGAPWSVTQDITFQYNYMLDSGNGFTISGDDNNESSQRTYRVSIQHCVMTNGNGNGAQNRLFQETRGPMDTYCEHCTMLNLELDGAAGFSENSPKGNNLTFKNNIITGGDYGFASTGFSPGTTTFAGNWTAYTCAGNVFINISQSGSSSSDYPGSNFFPANNAAVGFTNYAGGVYSLTGGSTYHNAGTDGTDPGPNFTLLDAYTAHCVDGQWGVEDTTGVVDPGWTKAEPPRVYIDSTYNPPTLRTVNVNSTATLTTALANAQRGDKIVVDASATYVGPFTLKNF